LQKYVQEKNGEKKKGMDRAIAERMARKKERKKTFDWLSGWVTALNPPVESIGVQQLELEGSV
tara:strand:+ start:2149 stop:2337 length:189 start_codon:yes stop_codon:yes gene_type:complete